MKLPRDARAALSTACLLGLLCCTPSIGADNVPPADFDAWVVALREEALAREISVGTLDQALTGIEPLPRVVELDRLRLGRGSRLSPPHSLSGAGNR